MSRLSCRECMASGGINLLSEIDMVAGSDGDWLEQWSGKIGAATARTGLGWTVHELVIETSK
jgi:hypothetical protein